jgi:hypothetical protein
MLREEAQFHIPVGNPRSRTFHQSRADARSAGKHRRLAANKEDTGDNELPEAPDQTSRRLGERPDEKAEAQQAARTNTIGQCPARKLAESVSPKECRKQKPHVGAKVAGSSRVSSPLSCFAVGSGSLVRVSTTSQTVFRSSIAIPDASLWSPALSRRGMLCRASTHPPSSSSDSRVRTSPRGWRQTQEQRARTGLQGDSVDDPLPP